MYGSTGGNDAAVISRQWPSDDVLLLSKRFLSFKFLILIGMVDNEVRNFPRPCFSVPMGTLPSSSPISVSFSDRGNYIPNPNAGRDKCGLGNKR